MKLTGRLLTVAMVGILAVVLAACGEGDAPTTDAATNAATAGGGEETGSPSGEGNEAVGVPASLADSGQLRVGWAEFSPYQFRDPESGDVTGLIIDIWERLAEDWDLELVLVEDSWSTIATALATDKFDLTLFNYTEERAEIVGYANPAFQAEFTVVFPEDSGFESFSDVDQPGNSITVTTGSSTEEVLNEAVENAEIISVREVAAALLQVQGGQADAMASTTDYLLPQLEENPDLAVANDSFGASVWSVAHQQGETELHEAVNEWLEDAKASGFISDLLESYEMVGIEVSPPGPLQED